MLDLRIKVARALLKEEGLDGLLISSAYNIAYLTGFDGFGTHEREGFAFITRLGLYIFADPRLSEGARKNSHNSTVVEFGAGKKLLPQIQEIITKEKLKVLGFEENLTHAEYKRFRKLKNIKFKLTEEIVETVRAQKNLDEVKSLQKACKLTDDCFTFILKKLRTGVTEKEIAWEMEKFIKENDGDLAFPSIVAFGVNSAVPHHKTGSSKLRANDIVLLDFGAKVDGYCADMTRTVFVGKANEKFKKIYEAVREAQELGFKINKNTTPHRVDDVVRKHVVSKGFSTVPHSIGHGVGLEVHELPHISPGFKDKLKINSAFTIEPGIYINGFGGVRIEDTVFYDGHEIISLTKSPKNLIEL